MATVSKYGRVVRFLSTWVMIHCVVLSQIPSMNCQTYGNRGDLPKSMLPFCVPLPHNLRLAQVIKIMGSVEQTGTRRPAPWLDVVLRPKCWGTESPFHLKMRFDNQKLVRNSFQYKNWGNEESDGPFPFSPGAQFVLLVEVQPDGYKVTGNGVPLWTFAHRINYTGVSVLQVLGESANIRRVDLINKADKDQPGKSQIIYPVPVGLMPAFEPSFPFWGYFPEGLQADKAIIIIGIFTTRLQRTTINLCADCFKGPIMLHLDLRFRFGNDINQAVRNIYHNGGWGNYDYEERSGPFPFRIREPFLMLIEVHPDSYNIEVNGVPCWTFKHKLPFTQVTEMTIERGPMSIWRIEYIDIAEKDKFASAGSNPGEAPGPMPAAITSSSESRIYRISAYSILFISLTCSLQLM